MRTITISYARLLETPRVGFDPVSGQGTISASYVVGEVTPAVTRADGSIAGPFHTDHPTATLVGSVSIPLGPSDVAGVKMAEMIQTIADQEGLTLDNGTDQVLTT